MKPFAPTTALALALALGSLGCFSVRHELPANAYFGRLPKGAAAPGIPFETQVHKNWALSGLLPYSRWSTSDLLAAQPGVPTAGSVQIREIETIFDPWDVFVTVIPGAFYGYYVYAPRSLHVSGVAQSADRK
jgi:hypothetical protein